jgi:hypothetical protein
MDGPSNVGILVINDTYQLVTLKITHLRFISKQMHDMCNDKLKGDEETSNIPSKNLRPLYKPDKAIQWQ